MMFKRVLVAALAASVAAKPANKCRPSTTRGGLSATASTPYSETKPTNSYSSSNTLGPSSGVSAATGSVTGSVSVSVTGTTGTTLATVTVSSAESTTTSDTASGSTTASLTETGSITASASSSSSASSGSNTATATATATTTGTTTATGSTTASTTGSTSTSPTTGSTTAPTTTTTTTLTSGSTTASTTTSTASTTTTTAAATGVVCQRPAQTPNYITTCLDPTHIALTFNGGPSQYTSGILTRLDGTGHTATFFMSGDLSQYQSIVAQMYATGHQMAILTTDSDDVTEQEYMTELHTLEEQFINIIGRRPLFYRDLGEDNSKQAYAGCMGFDYRVGTGTDIGDENAPDASTPEQNFVDAYNSGESIFTLHDDQSLTESMILPYVISFLAAKGKKSVTVAQCLGLTSTDYGTNA